MLFSNWSTAKIKRVRRYVFTSVGTTRCQGIVRGLVVLVVVVVVVVVIF